MTGKFPVQCSECGAWDHEMASCPRRVRGGKSVDESVDRQPPGSEGQVGLAIYRPPPGYEVGGPFGSIIEAAFWESQQQQHAQALPGTLGKVPEESVGKRHFGVSHTVSSANFGGFLEDFKKKTGTENVIALFMSPEDGRELENHLARASESSEARQELTDSFSGLSRANSTSVSGPGKGNRPVPVQPQELSDFDRKRFMAAIGENRKTVRDRRSRRRLDIGTIKVLGRPDTVEPARPQGRAGRGLLPGARNAQPNRPGASLLDTDSVPNQGQENISRGRGGAGSMAQGQGEIDNTVAQASRSHAQGGSLDGGSSSGADRREQDSSMHWSESQYEVGPGEIVGIKLEASDLSFLAERMARELPPGALVNVELVPVSVEDSTDSSPIIKGSLSRFFGRE